MKTVNTYIISALMLGAVMNMAPATFAQDAEAPVNGSIVEEQVEQRNQGARRFFGRNQTDEQRESFQELREERQGEKNGKRRGKKGHSKKGGVVKDIIYNEYLTDAEKAFVDSQKVQFEALKEKYKVQMDAAETSEEKREVRSQMRDEMKAIKKAGKDQHDAIKARLDEAGVKDVIKERVEASKDDIKVLHAEFREKVKALRESIEDKDAFRDAVAPLREEMKAAVQALLSQN
ncbi:MAG: hypothetical protein P1V18_05320 [Candidatus Gracilibacteria bacterium]|nr:hypothetical protein [Candidatus Gracilibacteria bacterium]